MTACMSPNIETCQIWNGLFLLTLMFYLVYTTENELVIYMETLVMADRYCIPEGFNTRTNI